MNLDLIASSASLCGFDQTVILTDQIVAREGYCLAVKALTKNDTYGSVETSAGEFVKIEPGMTFVGTLGNRQALKGFRGHTPGEIAVGDKLNILNMGGILGVCTADHPSLGQPIEVEVLGAVIDQKLDSAGPANIQNYALTPLLSLTKSAPIITICGTAMDTGKTVASAAIVEKLTEAGLRVAAAKLTGAALRRDVRNMRNHGAVDVVSFSECGFVSSTGKNVVPFAKAALAKLNECQPDVIVIELGDGFIGPYGVDEFLLDRELTKFTAATIVAATDLAGSWAAAKLFSERYRRLISAMTGPVTDNAVGCDYILESLGIPAFNAISHPAGLAGTVIKALSAGAGKATSKRQMVA